MKNIIIVLAIILSLTSKTLADNGAMAYAYPINHLSIDGDLSDWPSNCIKYPIEIISERGIRPESESDFTAYFMAGYNLDNNSVYIAVEVNDQDYVVDRSINPGWSEQDKHLLYIDPKHSRRGSCPISYSATEIKREMGGSEYGWDPQTKNANWDNIELKIARNNKTTIYEYRIELESISKNQVIGLDHVIYDKDFSDTKKKYSYIMWGNRAGKSGAPKRIGDLILLDENTDLVNVNGKISSIFQEELVGKTVDVISSSDEKLHVSILIDSTLSYKSKLPFGSYEVCFSNAYIKKDEEDIRLDLTKPLVINITHEQKELQPYVLEEMRKPEIKRDSGVLFGFSSSATSEIDQYMESIMSYYAVPGASMGLIVDDSLVYHKTYGVKNALTNEPVDEHTIFQAASITKPVFAYAVLRLSDQKVIDLDKPLHEYLKFDELEGDERYHKMTARHVLSHKSGLPNWGRRLIFEPGTSHGYSGEGFEYLKRVVEKITGKEILKILEEEVTIPFGLIKNTYFTREQEMFAKVAIGHNHNLPTTNWIINRVGVARSMYTEAKEFSKFILKAINGQGLSRSTYQDMLRSQTFMPKNDNNPVADWKRSFGLGILKKDSPYGMCYSHGGSNRYFQSLFEYYKDKKVGFVVFCNNNKGYELGNDLRRFLIIGK